MEKLRVSHSLESSSSSQEDLELLCHINEEKTEQLQNEPKHQRFKQWLLENGVKHPAVEYPVAFGKAGQLVGMAAAKDVPPQKAFLFVPQKLIISEYTVKNSEIRGILTDHPDIFKKHYDAEYLVLIVFMFYEMLKGEQSFWYPYLQIVNISDLPMLWSQEEIEELQDTVLKRDIQVYLDEFEEEWKLICKTFRENKYDQYFPGISDPSQEQDLRKVFLRAFISVVTRCFGWGLPKTAIIPFADCINHHNVDSTYELIKIDYHYPSDEIHPQKGPPQYYQKSKMSIDYSDIYLESQDDDHTEPYQHLQSKEKQWPNRTINHFKKTMKRQEVKQSKLSEIIGGPGKQIWDLDYISTSDEEDNDSDQDQEVEESEAEEKEEEKEQIQKKEIEVIKEGEREGEELTVAPASKIFNKISETEKLSESTQKAATEKVGQLKGTKPKKDDVIGQLIGRDRELVKRELHAQLHKIQMWKKQRQMFGLLTEEWDEDEDFSWWHYEDQDVFYAMGTKHKTFYKKGDQLFNCYGRRTNRFLLLNYGFCLRNNKYNSLGFKVFVNYSAPKKATNELSDKTERGSPGRDQSKASNDEDQNSRHQKIIKLKKDKLSEDLLQYFRANLIFNFKSSNSDKLLVSSPVDIEFELFVMACAINLLKSMLSSKYQTTLQEDQRLLEQPIENFRIKLALIHRINQKEILQGQIKLLSVLMRILARIKEKCSFKEAYSLYVSDAGESTEGEMVMNRVKLRKYLKELYYYQSVVMKNKDIV